MVERILKLLGEAKLGADNTNCAEAAVQEPLVALEHHESFLEELARKECHALPCREHGPLPADADGDHGNDEANRESEDRVQLDRREFRLLQWSSDDDDEYDSEDYVTDDEIDIHQANDERDESGEDSFYSESDADHEGGDEDPDHEALGWEDRTSMSTLRPQEELIRMQNYMHPVTALLVGLANSENEPLIRADIEWEILTMCPNLPSFYPAAELDDPFGARLLHGTLRMDPPLVAIEKILNTFPKSCLDMSGFFAACQFANPETSRKARRGVSRTLHPLLLKSQNKRSRLNPDENDAACDDDDDDDDGYCSGDSDVGEVVKLVMHRTINARKLNNIEWGMVAFLGDARTSAAHTKELLMYSPEAIIDTKHGAFGVSPLDRMVSGNFIHGDTKAWAEKLRLALRAASFVRLTKEQMEQREAKEDASARKEIVLPKGFFAPYSQFLRTVNSFLSLKDMDASSPTNQSRDLSLQSFYPYHELIRLLISPNFGGVKFGDKGFLHTLSACTNSDPNAFLRPDNDGNLPIHVALSSECNTALGIRGERRLIRYLLNLDNHAALCPENNGKGRLPLRMCIENGWPVYDLIVNAALSCNETLKTSYHDPSDAKYRFKNHIEHIMASDKPLLHDAFGGKYHPRFGIHGARELAKKLMSKVSKTQLSQSCLQSCLRSFIDSFGRTALHVALEHKWPVYDVLIQKNPITLEARDPTQHGFFPFQIAACAFVKQPHDHCVIDGDSVDHENSKPALVENQELLEASMLFELIRENPLCVSWSNPQSICPKKPSTSMTFSESEKGRLTSSTDLIESDQKKHDSSQCDRKRRLSSS